MEPVELEKLDKSPSLPTPLQPKHQLNQKRQTVDSFLGVQALDLASTQSVTAIQDSDGVPEGNRFISATPDKKTQKVSRLFKRYQPTKWHLWEPRTIICSLGECSDGYLQLATLLDSNDNWMIFHWFGYIQMRLLLEKQTRLISLEAKLDQIDYDNRIEHSTRLRETMLNNSNGEECRILLHCIEHTFYEYSRLLFSIQQMRCFERPTERDIECVKNYLLNEKPIVATEESWIHTRDDLIAFRPPKEPDWLEE
ncbi:MAG: hypothetical protein M1840_006512 [Geoglossum simile]|nr:MAG: hypothetical protein M1840_006512 [Geoglossum simile]